MESSALPTAKKVVLVSKAGYRPSHDDLLLRLISRRIKLFCVVGRDCELWEEVMDELVVGPTGEGDLDVTTTSHPDEDIAEVIAFAEDWGLDEPSDVEVIEV